MGAHLMPNLLHHTVHKVSLVLQYFRGNFRVDICLHISACGGRYARAAMYSTR